MCHVLHAGYGNTVPQGCEPMATLSLCEMAGLDCTHLTGSSEDGSLDAMQRLLWKKLAANCVINPLTALHRVLNGSIGTHSVRSL